MKEDTSEIDRLKNDFGVVIELCKSKKLTQDEMSFILQYALRKVIELNIARQAYNEVDQNAWLNDGEMHYEDEDDEEVCNYDSEKDFLNPLQLIKSIPRTKINMQVLEDQLSQREYFDLSVYLVRSDEKMSKKVGDDVIIHLIQVYESSWKNVISLISNSRNTPNYSAYYIDRLLSSKTEDIDHILLSCLRFCSLSRESMDMIVDRLLNSDYAKSLRGAISTNIFIDEETGKNLNTARKLKVLYLSYDYKFIEDDETELAPVHRAMKAKRLYPGMHITMFDNLSIEDLQIAIINRDANKAGWIAYLMNDMNAVNNVYCCADSDFIADLVYTPIELLQEVPLPIKTNNININRAKISKAVKPEEILDVVNSYGGWENVPIIILEDAMNRADSFRDFDVIFWKLLKKVDWNDVDEAFEYVIEGLNAEDTSKIIYEMNKLSFSIEEKYNLIKECKEGQEDELILELFTELEREFQKEEQEFHETHQIILSSLEREADRIYELSEIEEIAKKVDVDLEDFILLMFNLEDWGYVKSLNADKLYKQYNGLI